MIQEKDLKKVEYNQDTGEIFNYVGPLKTKKKYAIGGKMGYIGSLEKLLSILTNKELQLILKIFREDCNENNLLNKKFKDVTPSFDTSRRSKYKKKLISNMIIQEHRGRIMLNPFIFKPTSIKHNYQYLTQGLWKYLFEDKDDVEDEVKFHEDDVFGLPDVLRLK